MKAEEAEDFGGNLIQIFILLIGLLVQSELSTTCTMQGANLSILDKHKVFHYKFRARKYIFQIQHISK